MIPLRSSLGNKISELGYMIYSMCPLFVKNKVI